MSPAPDSLHRSLPGLTHLALDSNSSDDTLCSLHAVAQTVAVLQTHLKASGYSVVVQPLSYRNSVLSR